MQHKELNKIYSKKKDIYLQILKLRYLNRLERGNKIQENKHIEAHTYT